MHIDHADTANGLNQLTQSGGVALSYDGRGNLTSSGAANYGYNSRCQQPAHLDPAPENA